MAAGKAGLPAEPCSPLSVRAGYGITGAFRRAGCMDDGVLLAFICVIRLISAYKGSGTVTVWACPMCRLWVFMRIKGNGCAFSAVFKAFYPFACGFTFRLLSVCVMVNGLYGFYLPLFCVFYASGFSGTPEG